MVDYRALNAVTIPDAHPLPRIEDILQRQGKFRVWSVLDMKDGYHQVPLKKKRAPTSNMHVHATWYETMDSHGDGVEKQWRCFSTNDGMGT